MATVTEQGLYVAEHRGLRELYVSARFLAGHWGNLADRLGAPAAGPLREGAEAARGLLEELGRRTEARGLYGYPAAEGAGGRAANLRNLLGDRLLERNQAMRAAVLDVQAVVTLLGYLAALAQGRGDAELAELHRRWEARLRPVEEAARAAAVAMGEDPERAIAPADPTPAGQAGHRVAETLGALGESLDASPLGAWARRFRQG